MPGRHANSGCLVVAAASAQSTDSFPAFLVAAITIGQAEWSEPQVLIKTRLHESCLSETHVRS